jgi:hypothetical protein
MARKPGHRGGGSRRPASAPAAPSGWDGADSVLKIRDNRFRPRRFGCQLLDLFRRPGCRVCCIPKSLVTPGSKLRWPKAERTGGKREKRASCRPRLKRLGGFRHVLRLADQQVKVSLLPNRRSKAGFARLRHQLTLQPSPYAASNALVFVNTCDGVLRIQWGDGRRAARHPQFRNQHR